MFNSLNICNSSISQVIRAGGIQPQRAGVMLRGAPSRGSLCAASSHSSSAAAAAAAAILAAGADTCMHASDCIRKFKLNPGGSRACVHASDRRILLCRAARNLRRSSPARGRQAKAAAAAQRSRKPPNGSAQSAAVCRMVRSSIWSRCPCRSLAAARVPCGADRRARRCCPPTPDGATESPLPGAAHVAPALWDQIRRQHDGATWPSQKTGVCM